jgi:hypothetical protein
MLPVEGGRSVKFLFEIILVQFISNWSFGLLSTAMVYKKRRKRVMKDVRISEIREALLAVLSTAASKGIDVDSGPFGPRRVPG